MRTILISKTQPKFDIIQNASVLIAVVNRSNRVQNLTFLKERSSHIPDKSAHIAAPNLMFFKTGKITLSVELVMKSKNVRHNQSSKTTQNITVCCLNVTSSRMGSNHHTGAFKYLLLQI